VEIHALETSRSEANISPRIWFPKLLYPVVTGRRTIVNWYVALVKDRNVKMEKILNIC
jgi:hypothetical protein